MSGGGWTWILLDVVGAALLGLFLFYGQRQTAKRRGEKTSGTVRALVLVGAASAVALTIYLLVDASLRLYDLGPASGPPKQAGPAVPSRKERADAQRKGEPAKEATCKTAPGAEQAGMPHDECVFIASQIPVLASNTRPEARSSSTVPSAALGPGSEVPPDVGELKPLPASVTGRLLALRGFRYFLAGQDIVIVANDGKVAFTVNVKVVPN